MGTRGFIGLTIEGKTIATYNHYDSYPSHLGVQVGTFVQDADLAKLPGQIKKLRIVDEQDKPTKAQRGKLERLDVLPANVSTGTDWYSALRDLQGDLAGYLRVGYFPASEGILEGGWGAEWGYIVNLDSRTLLVYKCRWNEVPSVVDRLSFDTLLSNDFELAEYMEKLEAHVWARIDAEDLERIAVTV